MTTKKPSTQIVKRTKVVYDIVVNGKVVKTTTPSLDEALHVAKFDALYSLFRLKVEDFDSHIISMHNLISKFNVVQEIMAEDQSELIRRRQWFIWK